MVNEKTEDGLLYKAASVTARAVYRSGRFVYRKYKELEPSAQKKLHKGILYAGSVAAIFSIANKTLSKLYPGKPAYKIETRDIKKEDSIIVEDMLHKARMNSEKFCKVYNITNKKSLKKLYSEALPLIQMSMLPTEILLLDAYSDSGKTINTVGLGSCWFPENGDPKSTKWVPVSKYIKTHENLRVNGNFAMELTDGWFCHREDGRIINYMYEELKDCQLKAHEFAAIATCMYNNESIGKKLCQFIKKNYKDPIKCAHKIMSLETRTCKDGILVRHTHEALMYLNLDNYVSKIPSFKIKEGVNSKGNKYYTTSVYQVSPKSCKEMRADLAKGSLEKAREQSKKICNYICKDGKTLVEIICDNIMDEDIRYSMIGVKEKKTVYFEELRVDALYVDMLYKESLLKYHEKDYSGALNGFKKIIGQGFDGADLRDDLAQTYYNLGEYDKCIEECQKILETGERQMYSHANYIAGKAYEAKGCAYVAMNRKKEAKFNFNRSKINYKRAAGLAEKNNMPDSTFKKYKYAVSRVSNRMDSLNKVKQVKHMKQPQKNGRSR